MLLNLRFDLTVSAEDDGVELSLLLDTNFSRICFGNFVRLNRRDDDVGSLSTSDDEDDDE